MVSVDVKPPTPPLQLSLSGLIVVYIYILFLPSLFPSMFYSDLWAILGIICV